jgi:hypothetical protein
MDKPLTQSLEAAAEQFRQEHPGIAAFLDFDFLNDQAVKQFTPFGRMGKDQIFGIRILGGGGRIKQLYGLPQGRPVRMKELQPGKALGYIPAGLAHHLTHEFGWWHVNGADEFYLGVPITDGRIALVIFEAIFPERVDWFNWYCLKCFAPLHGSAVNIGRVGLEGYWKAESAAVATFNADEKLRTCKACGTVHPLAYSVFDSPDKKPW